MKPIVRSILAILAGTLAAGVLIAGIEALGHLLYPPPPGVDWNDPEAVRAALASAPPLALGFILIAWAIGTLVGAWTVARLAGRAPLIHGLILGAIFLVAGIANMAALPHPFWFNVLGYVIFVPMACLGALLAGRGTIQPA